MWFVEKYFFVVKDKFNFFVIEKVLRKGALQLLYDICFSFTHGEQVVYFWLAALTLLDMFDALLC